MNNRTVVIIHKQEKDWHITQASQNGWKVKQIDQHATNKDLLVIDYIKIREVVAI